MADCVHGMNPAWCADCTGRGIDLDGPVHATGPTIAAMHEGKCAHCADVIEVGDSITHSTDADGWCLTAHTDRPPPVPREPKPVRHDVDLSGF